MALTTVIKQPSESRLFTMEFAALLADGETVTGITSVTVAPVTASPLTASGNTFAGTQIQFRLAGGLETTRYKVTAIITTSSGNTLEGEGLVQCDQL
jgi:hypothetical protein